MKKGLLFGVLCLWLVGVRAARVDTAYVYSEYFAFDSSRIFLVADVMVSSSPCSINSINVFDSSNQITIKVCYDGGPATTTCRYLDTFDLGVRKNDPLKIIAIIQEWGSAGTFACAGHSFYKDTFEFIINLPLGITTFDVGSLSIYPNPAPTQLTCLLSQLTEPTSLRIESVDGKIVHAIHSMEKEITQIDISMLPAGLYFLTIQNGQQRRVRKFVKE